MRVDAHQSSQLQGLRIVAEGDDTVLDLDAMQGFWSEQQYLRLTDFSNRLLEFTDGSLEVLPMPTDKHQVVLRFLFFEIFSLLQQLGGTVLCAPLRLQIRQGKFREPDLLLLLDANDPRRQNAFWLGADLVVEIVSPDSPERDTRVKRVDYAEASIPEYWIVNPQDEAISILRLSGSAYVEHATFRRGETVTSPLLPELSISVGDLFDAR